MTTDDFSPLPDDDVPELDLLASRSVDGDLDHDERARVAGDPVVEARAEQMSSVRQWVGDIDPVSASVTAAAVAAALAAADDALPAVAPVAPVIALRRRRSWNTSLTWLGAAAAAIAVVIGVGSLTDSGADDNFAADTNASSESTPLDAVVTAQDAADGGVSGGAGPEMAPAETIGEMGLPSATDAPMLEPDNSAKVGDERPPLLSSVDDAAAYSTQMPMATPVNTCGPAGSTVVLPSALLGDDPTTAVAVEVVQTAEGDLVAYDLTDCSEVSRTPSP